MTMETSTNTTTVNNNDMEKHTPEDKMQTENTMECSSPPPRVPSPMIMVEDESLDATPQPPAIASSPDPAISPATTPTSSQSVMLTPTRDRKKSSPGPSSSTQPRQRKRSQPVRGDLLPDPDKLLRYKHHEKKEDEELEDPTVPGGQPKPPPEPRQPGQGGAERKRSTVTFCPVIHTIDK